MNSRKNALPPMAVIAGTRTPFCKAYGAMAELSAVDLGVSAVTSVLAQSGLVADDIDEAVFGNVSGPADASNIARVIALKAQIPHDRIAHTVNRNCASGMESVLTAWQILREGRARTIVAGGTESMSGIPLLVREDTARLLSEVSRARTSWQKLRILSRLRPRHFRPVPAVLVGLTDPVCGLSMGATAERLAKEFSISRQDQDQFALESHQKAVLARERCFLSGEVRPVHVAESTNIEQDNVPRPEQTMEQLARLRPFWDSQGTVTAGNSCPLTDGAAAVVLTNSENAGMGSSKPLGYVTSYAIAGCAPERMGLGPVYATARLLRETGLKLSDFDLFEINEAFAAQVLACLAAFESKSFARQELGLATEPGTIPRDRLNIHGGAIALGHPVGTTGTRLIVTLLRALREKGLKRGLATLCVGGGQGVAIVVEQEI